METKIISLRLTIEQIDFLKSLAEGNVNRAVMELIESKQMADKYADREIKNKFLVSEWSFIADSLNGTLVEGDFRYSKEALIAGLEDSATYDGLDSKWAVNLAELTNKINLLSSAAVEAIYRRVETFWENSQQDLEKWANY